MYYYPQFSSFFSLCSQQEEDYCWPRESTILGQSTLVIHVGATEDMWGRKLLAIQKKKNCCWLKMKVRERCGEKERLWWITSGFDILFNYFGSCPIFLWVESSDWVLQRLWALKCHICKDYMFLQRNFWYILATGWNIYVYSNNIEMLYIHTLVYMHISENKNIWKVLLPLPFIHRTLSSHCFGDRLWGGFV